MDSAEVSRGRRAKNRSGKSHAVNATAEQVAGATHQAIADVAIANGHRIADALEEVTRKTVAMRMAADMPGTIAGAATLVSDFLDGIVTIDTEAILIQQAQGMFLIAAGE